MDDDDLINDILFSTTLPSDDIHYNEHTSYIANYDNNESKNVNIEKDYESDDDSLSNYSNDEIKDHTCYFKSESNLFTNQSEETNQNEIFNERNSNIILEENPEKFIACKKKNNKIKSNPCLAKEIKDLCLNPFNDFYYKEFSKLSEQAKYKDPNNKFSLVYKKVCQSIKRYPFPIVSSYHYNNLIGVGNTISGKFDEFIKKYKEIIKEDKLKYTLDAKKINPHVLKGIKAKSNKIKKDASEMNSKKIVSYNGVSISDNNNSKNFSNFSSQHHLKNSLKEEIKKKYKMQHIRPYSGLWTLLISAYIINLQENKLTMSIVDIIENAKLISLNFEGFLIFNLPKNEDFVELQSHTFIEKNCKLKLNHKFESSFLTQTISFNSSLINFGKVELEKSGIIISNVNDEINISLNEDYLDCINNKVNINSLDVINERNDQNEDINEIDFCCDETTKKLKKKNSDLLKLKSESKCNLEISMLSNTAIETKFKQFYNSNINGVLKSKDVEYEIILLIDVRELDHQGKPVNEFIEVTKKLGISRCRVQQLNIGDFLWIIKDIETEEEYFLDYLVERKSLDDLAKSIIDGRYKEQKCRIKEAGVKNVYYMFENLKFDTKHTTITMEALNTAIYNTLNIHDFNILKTESIKQSAEVLLGLDTNIRKLFKSKEFDISNMMNFNEFQVRCHKSRNSTIKKIFLNQLRCVSNYKLNLF